MNYDLLASTISNLTEGETDEVALMATVVCEIHHSDTRFDWTGFYRVTVPEMLKIGPYQGGHGCLVIPFSRGVCGKVARTGNAEVVDDVNEFTRHIACSSTTISEIVLPVRNTTGELIAVLDIDSNQRSAFNQNDVKALQQILDSVFAK
ncbi:MAG: GAF domain-containing protein [Paracoccaceae bacterium]